MMKKIQKRLAGLTLTELLCVMAIITILAAMYLGVISRAFTRVRSFLSFLKGM
jgi:prepilin-type N-terminal cleavage/methylation domain-containing protein